MARSLLLGATLLACGCAMDRSGGPRTTRSEKPSWEDRAKAAHGRIDRAADNVGQILYPPLFVAAFPLWALAGFGTSGK